MHQDKRGGDAREARSPRLRESRMATATKRKPSLIPIEAGKDRNGRMRLGSNCRCHQSCLAGESSPKAGRQGRAKARPCLPQAAGLGIGGTTLVGVAGTGGAGGVTSDGGGATGLGVGAGPVWARRDGARVGPGWARRERPPPMVSASGSSCWTDLGSSPLTHNCTAARNRKSAGRKVRRTCRSRRHSRRSRYSRRHNTHGRRNV